MKQFLTVCIFSLLLFSPLSKAQETVQYSDGLHTRSPGASNIPTAHELARVAPGVNPNVIELALAAMRCAQAHGEGPNATRLAVIDYSRSSRTPRLWIFDLPHRKLLYHELVAHGSGSGGDIPTRFSNVENSRASSVGLYVTRAPYHGHNGLSLRMDGLDPGFNDAAMDRAVVLHGANYVNPKIGHSLGRLGRSWGCPAVPKSLAGPIIDVMKDGQFLFSYYPDKAWLTRSSLEQCAAARIAEDNNRSNFIKTLARR